MSTYTELTVYRKIHGSVWARIEKPSTQNERLQNAQRGTNEELKKTNFADRFQPEYTPKSKKNLDRKKPSK